MWNTATDERLPLDKRQELLRKSLPNKLRKWRHNPVSCSERKIRSLRSLMRELQIDEQLETVKGKTVYSILLELKDLVIVSDVMES